MTHAGLVQVRQGEGTLVRDYRQYAGLDLLPHLLMPDGRTDTAVARSILEARLYIGPKIAELAAARAGAALSKPLDAAIAALEAATGDLVAQQYHALIYWDHIVDGADSIAFRLMFNGLRAAYEPAIAVLANAMAPEVTHIEAYRALAYAIVIGDSDAAQAADDLLRPATLSMLAIVSALEQAS